MGMPSRYALMMAAFYGGAFLITTPDQTAYAGEDNPTATKTAQSDMHADTQQDTGLAPLDVSQWPPVFPPLEVYVTPLKRNIKDKDAQEPKSRIFIPMANGQKGDLLNFLRRDREHKTDWQADEDFAASTHILRPDQIKDAAEDSLVEQSDFATIMGRNFLGLNLGQIYNHFGFEADGTKIRPSGHGAISPIDPVNCLEGGISCRASLTGKD